MAPWTGSATPEQVDTLLNFLDEHRDLARGHLRSVEGKLQAKRLWDEVCNLLNAMGGCTKTVTQWQKVWFDRKHLAKKAAADSRRSATMTGGGPAVTSSPWELKVLNIMGDGFGLRQTEARVPAFPEAYELAPSTSSQPPRLELPLGAIPRVECSSAEPSQELIVPDQIHEIIVPSSQSSRHRPRRMRSAAGSDVRRRLFEYEDRREQRETARNQELAG
ncbi:uncharacterized protein LOC111350815 [Spodoptera litura]|uniref:Regulatory protein zeste n=1 Tax=Spodoptera litura TaxID=69820 RepID=A0A9J7DU93_SPOLT|nr:uncharacterized protein LOC111350815 [Spodoptera litura]